MNVVFLLRRDAKTKPGGDTSKTQRYVERLAQLGIDACVTHERRSLRHLKPDIVHLINLDLPAENLTNARAARAVGAKVVLSTIRHPFDGITAFYQHGDDSLYRKLRHAGVSAARGIGFRELIKLGMVADSGAIPALRQYVHLQRDLLRSVDFVLPMATGELVSLRRDFAFDAPTRVIPNALSFSQTQLDPLECRPEYDVISVGRVEPRKNSLSLARMASRSPHRRMAFAGQLNHRHPKYVREFLHIVETSPNVDYLGVLPHAEVRNALQRSMAYVNPAWFEVVSQADFEALSLDLPILTTTQSYLSDFIEGGGWISPVEFSRLSNDHGMFDELIARAAPAKLVVPTRTWAQAGDELAAVYRQLAV